jgi:hypothetical protein
MKHEFRERRTTASMPNATAAIASANGKRQSRKTTLLLSDESETIRAELICKALHPAGSRTTAYRVELSASRPSAPIEESRNGRLRFVAIMVIRDDRNSVNGAKRLIALKASFLFHAASDRDCPFALRKIARELIERLPEIAESRQLDLLFDIAEPGDIPQGTMTPVSYEIDNAPIPIREAQEKPRRRVSLTMDHYNRRRCGFLAYGIRWHRCAVYVHCAVVRWPSSERANPAEAETDRSYYAVEITTPDLIDKTPLKIVAREIVSIERNPGTSAKRQRSAAGGIETISAAMNAGLRSMIAANVLPLPVGLTMRAFLAELDAIIAFNSEQRSMRNRYAPPWRALRSTRFVFADPDPDLKIACGLHPNDDPIMQKVAQESERDSDEQTSQIVASAQAHRIWRIFDLDDERLKLKR